MHIVLMVGCIFRDLMKKLARLILFFSLTFVIVLIFTSIFRFLTLWVDSTRIFYQNLHVRSAGAEQLLLAACRASLPLTLFMVILLSLSYSVRKKMHAVMGIAVIFLLSVLFCLASYIGIERIEAYNPKIEIPDSLNRSSGLILSRLDTDIVLLGVVNTGDTAVNSGGIYGYPRVISFPERPLIYQEIPLGTSTAFALPLDDKTPWFVQSLLIDFSLCAREMETRRSQGLVPFLIFTGSLFFLLVSLRFVFESSAWPLANLFLGAVIFRLVLVLFVFLQSGEAADFLLSFINRLIPADFIIPAVFAVCAVLIILYTAMASFARRRRNDD